MTSLRGNLFATINSSDTLIEILSQPNQQKVAGADGSGAKVRIAEGGAAATSGNNNHVGANKRSNSTAGGGHLLGRRFLRRRLLHHHHGKHRHQHCRNHKGVEQNQSQVNEDF